MTDTEVNILLSRQAAMEGIVASILASQVTTAMQLGLARFWNARPWSFRRYEYSLATTTSASDYALPNDMGSIGEVRDQTISTGNTVMILPKDEFDRRFPKPDYYPTGVPVCGAVWNDQAAVDPGKNKIRFFPRPSGSRTFKIDIFTNTPASWVAVPDEFSEVALLIAGKFLMKYGSLDWRTAEESIQQELARLDSEDTMYQSRPSTMTVDFPTVNMSSEIGVPWA